MFIDCIKYEETLQYSQGLPITPADLHAINRYQVLYFCPQTGREIYHHYPFVTEQWFVILQMKALTQFLLPIQYTKSNTGQSILQASSDVTENSINFLLLFHAFPGLDF